MKISLMTNINAKLEIINKFINKNIEPALQTDVQKVIEAVDKIWSRDIIVRNYTSHKLDHNIRVLYYCYEIIKMSGIKLDKTGYYILTISALLHDFGMQCSDKNIISLYCDEKTCIDDVDIQSIVRSHHAEICVEWIKQLYNDTTSECGKLISLINSRLMPPICDAIKYHSGDKLYALKENLTYYHNNEECKLMPIILILRLADELDIGCERSDNDLSLRDYLKHENLSFFWLHYITQISFVSNNIIKITIETHSTDKDKQNFFENIIYNGFISKNKRLLDMFITYCEIYFSIISETKTNDFLEKFDPVIYDYLVSKNIDDDNYFKNLVQVTYSVPDIGKVFDLDCKLLPMIYKGADHYAVTKEQSYICAKRNANMTIGAYKCGKVIGYLTLWPISAHILDKILNFEILESEVDFCNDLYTYKEYNLSICWYVSGLGISNEERGRRNDPQILLQLIEKAIEVAKDILKPNNIIVERIGAIVYSRAAENLCLKHFGMEVIKEADYTVNNFTPKSFCVDVKVSPVDFIKELRGVLLA